MTDAQVFLVAGLVAAVLAIVEVYRSRGQDLAAWGVGVIAVALIIVSVRP